MQVLTDTRATRINVEEHSIDALDPTGTPQQLSYDALIVGTGAISARPPIRGLSGYDALGLADGVHLLHSMGDTFAVMDSLQQREPATAVIVGAGYIGLEMAEALTTRGIRVTQIEALPEVLPTVDPGTRRTRHAELERHGVEVLTNTAVNAITRADTALTVTASHDGHSISRTVDFVLVVVGVRPDTELAADAGAHLGVKGAIAVNETMRTNLPDIFAAGDCVHTHHRLLGITWLPLGTTAHKQGRVAGENALGGHAHFAGSLGTQVVKVFDLVAARTGLRHNEALDADLGWTPVTSRQSSPDDHKAYYPGSTPVHIRITGDQHSGRLLGAQLVGHRTAEIAKRVDTYATALFHEMTVDSLSELDLSYTPPLGSPWDATKWQPKHGCANTSPPRPDP